MTLLHTSLSPTSAVPVILPSAGAAPQIISVPGAALLHSPQANPAAADAALKALRTFNGARRRVVWLNGAELARAAADPRVWGQKLVDNGGANLVVVLGAGRDIAIAARDAGLPLGRVVVCRDEVTARNVLADSICPGDAVLVLGLPADACHRLAERLEAKFERDCVTC